MLTVSFVSEEEKQQLIEKYSTDYELIETRYLFSGNELIFQEKVNGLTLEERIALQEQQLQEQAGAIAELTTLIATMSV